MTPGEALDAITMSHAETMRDTLRQYGVTAFTLDGIATAICAQMLTLSFTYPEYAQALLHALPPAIHQPMTEQLAVLVREIPITIAAEATS